LEPGALLGGDDVVQAGRSDPDTCDGEHLSGTFEVLVPVGFLPGFLRQQ
jgi:hypothetical protein